MKKNSKSGLCLKHIITIIITILVFAGIQLFVLKNNNILTLTSNIEENIQADVAEVESKTDETEEVVEEDSVTVARVASEDTTSRSSMERETTSEEVTETIETVAEEVVEPQYKSISEITISKDMDLTQRCGVSKEDFKILMTNLKVDTSGFFEENSDTIYDVCEKYEINEIFFCGLIAGESGWNISSNHKRTHNYISMMSGGKLISYSTVEEGLEAAAKLLHTYYLSEGGSFYSGKTLSAVKKKFCPSSSTWVNLIYSCMSQIV